MHGFRGYTLIKSRLIPHFRAWKWMAYVKSACTPYCLAATRGQHERDELEQHGGGEHTRYSCTVQAAKYGSDVSPRCCCFRWSWSCRHNCCALKVSRDTCGQRMWHDLCALSGSELLRVIWDVTPCSAVMMRLNVDRAGAPETSVNCYRTVRHHIPEDSIFNIVRPDNFTSRIDSHVMKARRGVQVIAPPFFNLVLDAGGWSTSCPGRRTPGNKRRYVINCWLGGPTASLDDLEKTWTTCCRDTNPGSSSPQSLYQLRYPASRHLPNANPKRQGTNASAHKAWTM